MEKIKMLLAVTIIASVMGVALARGMAFESPQNIALKDYKISEGGSVQNVEQREDVCLSEFSIPIYKMVNSDRILAYKGAKISELIEGTEENFWFVVNKSEPEGIVVATSEVPVKLGGENRSKDLMKIYRTATNSLQQGDQIRYFEMDGQGGFVVIRSNSEEVYLSKSASQLLNISAEQKVEAKDLIARIKEYVMNVSSPQ